MSRTAKETIYDEQINPLMAQILEICKQHKIAMLADFDLGHDPEVDDDTDRSIKCTSALLGDEFESGGEMLKALKILRTITEVVRISVEAT